MTDRNTWLRACRWMAACLLLATLLAGCATTGQKNALDSAQYTYSAAIRWGDFEGAWQMVDPAFREAHPLTDLELERYKQVQVTAYHDLAGQELPDGDVVREIEIGVVNRHTLVERKTRYTERWHYDAQAERWWMAVGLPDFWVD